MTISTSETFISRTASAMSSPVVAFNSTRRGPDGRRWRDGVRTHGPIPRRPLLAHVGQRTEFAADALDRDLVDRDRSQARIEALGSLPGGVGILGHQRIEEVAL